MNLDKYNNIVVRVFFFGAFLNLAVAVLEKALNLMGLSVLGLTVNPHRWLVWSVVLLVFVMALLLVQIRDAVKAS